MEEEEKHTIVELTYGGIHASTCLMDDNCIAVFVMHALKDTPYEIPLSVVDPSLKEVDDHIPYGSTNEISYSSIDGVGIGINEMNTLGGKGFFYFYNIFSITGIVLTCEQQQRFIL